MLSQRWYQKLARKCNFQGTAFQVPFPMSCGSWRGSSLRGARREARLSDGHAQRSDQGAWRCEQRASKGRGRCERRGEVTCDSGWVALSLRSA